jgi:Ni,Fe-hydrogenase III component G
MNNKRKKMQKKIFDLFGIDFLNRVKDRALVLGFCM